MFRFHYLNDAPLIDVSLDAQLDGNANGPSLIEAPVWLENPPGKYLLYFAHHEGRAIKMASSDCLTGPWLIHAPDPLSLSDSLFATCAPDPHALHPEAKAFIESGADGNYPHIASPDIWVDDENQQIRMYYHGRMPDGRQRTRLALSSDAIDFVARPDILATSYMRVFKHQRWFYALTMPGQLYRSRDGFSAFEKGPLLTTESIRHHAILQLHHQCYVFWTRAGDQPERILVSELDIDGNWQRWRFGKTSEVHQPQKPWEGSLLPNEPSQYGAIMHPVNQLRDPAIFQQGNRIYLLYSIAGEQGIAIGELTVS